MNTATSRKPTDATETSAPARPRTLVIADDHFALRLGLSALIDRRPDFEVVASVEDGGAAVAACIKHKPDLALFDIVMPNLDGIEATRRVIESCPNTRVIILTTYDDERDITRAVEAGASGYLMKGFQVEYFLDAVEKVMSGETFFPPEIVAKLERHAKRPALTTREQQVLEHLAIGRSKAEIAESLSIAEETVKTHLRSVFKKLGTNDRVSAVTEALRIGLVRL